MVNDKLSPHPYIRHNNSTLKTVLNTPGIIPFIFEFLYYGHCGAHLVYIKVLFRLQGLSAAAESSGADDYRIPKILQCHVPRKCPFHARTWHFKRVIELLEPLLPPPDSVSTWGSGGCVFAVGEEVPAR